MHLKCQKRMLEAAEAARGGSGAVLQCGVCHANYSNASTSSVWRLSMLGALWCTCCAGVGVMWWSGSTVLDRGSGTDPDLNLGKVSWWSYQIHHLTWWRLVGVIYIAISFFMACVAVNWLLLDLFGARMLGLSPAEPLCTRRYLFHVWKPDDTQEGGEQESAFMKIRNLLFKRKGSSKAGQAGTAVGGTVLL